jgi:solute carrier family 25 protein 34/35
MRCHCFLSVGLIGACVGSPFFLVKARIQAASSAATINAQYAYTGMVRSAVGLFFYLYDITIAYDLLRGKMRQVDGFRQILRTEGPRGLYRGMSGAVPRVSVSVEEDFFTFKKMRHYARQQT